MNLGKRAGVRMGMIRTLRKMSQVDAAEALEVSQSHLSRVEAGKTQASFDLLEKASALYRVDVTAFLAENTPVNGVTGAKGVTVVDENGRAIVCPRCKRGGYPDEAIYCPNCAYPLFNMCSGEGRHVNSGSAKYCVTCASPTFWGMNEDELKHAGVPPLP